MRPMKPFEYLRSLVNYPKPVRCPVVERATRRHKKAMNKADDARHMKRQGRDSETQRLFLQAFRLELSASELIRDMDDFEPSRTILHESAAALATECGLKEEASELLALVETFQRNRT